MKSIIIAAGSGKRIGGPFIQLPKSMIRVNDKTIIEYQISVLKKFGIDEIIVITGPYSEKFTIDNLNYVNDKNFAKHDILGSLMEAKNFLNDDVLILYSDILFEEKIIEQILNSKNNISLAIDLNWKKHYEGRTQHPLSEAENVEFDSNNQIIKIQKNINKNHLIGEFLGIVKLNMIGSKIFVEKYNELLKNHEGHFHQATSLIKAYLTDFFQELIDSGIKIEPIFISGKWCEIDTLQDLKRAELLFNN